MAKWIISVTACVVACLEVGVTDALPGRSGRATFACGVLKNTSAEEKWSLAVCNVGVKPELSECIKEVNALWERAAAKCPNEEHASAAVALPRPPALACSVLLNKEAERKWSSSFCNVGPNPELPECVKEVEALWEKAAAACLTDQLGDAAVALPNPSDILGKLACGVLTNKAAEEKWSDAFCNVGPNPELPECIKEVNSVWDKVAEKCHDGAILV
mmetsp:Transcript_48323/g.105537  ORF Transcript_48323/g.105537 Transcript_48323/m.105537 type:complete len:216 (+) Transcript_48323:60-707(+)